MAVPSTIWTRQYVYGQAITGRYEAPITPVATTIVATTSAAFSTNSRGSKFQFSPSSTGAHGGRVVFTATRDLSVGRFIGFQINQFGWPFPGPSAVIDTFANGGVSILFFDSSGNWSEFYIEGSDFDEYDLEDGGWAAFRSAGISGPLQVCLERTRTPDASSGTLDWANIDGHEFIIRVISTSGNTPNFDVGSMFVFDSPEHIEGEIANPGGFDTLSDDIRDANDNYQQADVFKDSAGNFNGGIGELYEPRYTYQIGDGSTPTYFRDSGSTLAEYPTPESGIAIQPALLLAGIDRGLEINTSSTCDIVLDGTILASAPVAGGESFVNVAGDTGGSVLFNNMPIYRKTYVNLRHATSTSCVFDACEQVEIDTTTVLTSATIRNTARTSRGLYTQSVATNFAAITAEFKASNAGIDLTAGIGGAGLFTFSGITAEAGHTVLVWNESTSNTITVAIAAGVNSEVIDLWFNYDNEASGPFTEGELLTFANGATATLRVLIDNGAAGTMYCTYIAGATPPDNNGITGGSSSATADVDEASGANRSTITISAPAVSYTLQLPNIVDASRFQVFNVTTATELTNSTTSGGTGIDETYTKGTDYSAADVGRYRVTFQSGASANETIEGSFTFPTGTATNSIPTAQVSQATYNAHAKDGSTVTGIAWDSGNLEFDFNEVDDIVDGQDIGSWYYYFITTAVGIDEVFGAIDWAQVNKITNVTANVALTFDNVSVDPLKIINCWIERDDGVTIIASTSNSIQIDPPAVFAIETGISGLTPEQEDDLALINTVDIKIGTPSVDVSADIAAVQAVVDLGSTQASVDAVPTAVENRTEMDSNSTQLAAILTDTGTTLPADIAAVKADTGSIKTKTDELTFTVANKVDSNVKSVNDTTVAGSGTELDPWNP